VKLPDDEAYWTPDQRFKSGYRLTPHGRAEVQRRQHLRRRWLLLSLALFFSVVFLAPVGAAGHIPIFTLSPFLVAGAMIAYGIHRARVNRDGEQGEWQPEQAPRVYGVYGADSGSQEPVLTVVPDADVDELGPVPGGVARKRESISPALKREVWRRDKGCCRHCRISDADAMERDGEHLQYDHVLPFSRNGSTELDNLQLLCRPCNEAKSARFAG